MMFSFEEIISTAKKETYIQDHGAMKGPLPPDDRMLQRNTGLAFSG